MIFEFLLVYHGTDEMPILQVVRECLAKVLEDNMNVFDAEEIARMIIPQVERRGELSMNESGALSRRSVLGFALDLPEGTTSTRIVVDEFSEALSVAPVAHVLKFEDPLLKSELARWSDEIAALEMKLRRVLSLVYLHAYQDGDFYNLLREEAVQPTMKDRPNAEQMKQRAENQFFHLTFSQYVELNKRPEFKLAQLLELVRSEDVYENVRAELARMPVGDEDDAVLLAGLRERMDAIEAMRNCCAHSRRPSKRVEQNYINARPLIDRLLDQYLMRWETTEPAEEMVWDRKAREAVEVALDHAEWNEEAKTITLFDPDDPRMRATVGTREELESSLAGLASGAFYSYVPHDEGSPAFECDQDGIVWAALEKFEERLDGFFGNVE